MAFRIILLSLASLLPITTATIYNVLPNDNDSFNKSDIRSGESLEHYCIISKYFTSHSQLKFMPGQYFLNDDLVIQNLTNFSLIGENCNIRCTSHVSIIIAKQKQPGCKKSARPIRSHKYKRPKTLISSKAKKLNVLLRIFLLE